MSAIGIGYLLYLRLSAIGYIGYRLYRLSAIGYPIVWLRSGCYGDGRS